MRRRGFLKVILSTASAAVLPRPVSAPVLAVDHKKMCRWAHDACAPSPRDQYSTECGKDFLTVNGTREANEFFFCPYCGQRIHEIPLKKDGLCGRYILDNLPGRKVQPA